MARYWKFYLFLGLLLPFLCLATSSSSNLFAKKRPVSILDNDQFTSTITGNDGGDFVPPPPPPHYETRYFDQVLDHFNFRTSPATYKQRYLWADKYWTGKYPNGCKGPIFFYTGNESPVTDYYKASGLFTQVLGPKHNGLLVFAEHRYFGESMPFGAKSWDPDKIGYLSSEQALADYATLITHIKKTTPGAEHCPVIAFGGSYGGMLTAWFRAKYPHIVIGGLAGSAPFGFVGTGVSPSAFSDAASNTFATARDGCGPLIKRAFEVLADFSQTANGRDTFAKAFKLCGPLKSVDDANAVIQWVADGLIGMAMLDYPYPTNYGIQLPGWPVNKTCDRLIDSYITSFKNEDDVSDDFKLAQAFAYAIGTFYNFTGGHTCYNITTDVPDWGGCCGWDYLACTELFFPFASSGIFPPAPFNLTASIEACKAQFNVTLRPDWGKTEFGGLDFSGASNIIFSNGLLDPWHTSGVTKSLSDSLIAIVIPESAHHFDLRGPNALDPIYVKQARIQEGKIIAKWLADYWKQAASNN